MQAYDQTLTYLHTLKLKGAAARIDELITDAERGHSSYMTFLNTLLSTEIAYRVTRRVERNMVEAHFPAIKTMETFDFGRITGIGKSEVVNLLDCHWVDNQENLLFFGPPGIGKTHLAIAFGVTAVEKGDTVCFERITNLMKLLKTAEIQQTAEHRIRRILKSHLVIIDEIG